MDSGDMIRVAVPGQPGAYQMVHRDHAAAKGLQREHPNREAERLKALAMRPDCVHLGAMEPGSKNCNCGGIFACALHGRTIKSINGIWPNVTRYCRDCADYRAFKPQSVTRMNFPWSFRGEPYRNSAIFEDGGKLRMLLRIGWASAGLAVCDLGPDLQPIGHAMPLWARHSVAPGSQEDPRVFTFRGRLHVAFCGIKGEGREMVVSILYARMNQQGMGIEEVFAPHYAGRAHWEKNWSFFEHDGAMFAVYAIAPRHQVLAIQNDSAALYCETEWAPPWRGGQMRGGASPVLVGDEFWSFFHGSEDHPGRHPKRTYTMGVYTFSAKPPFEPRRCTAYPILVPDESDRNGLDVSVVFPCGAVKRDNTWLVSYGYHDREVRIAEFDHHKIEKALK